MSPTGGVDPLGPAAPERDRGFWSRVNAPWGLDPALVRPERVVQIAERVGRLFGDRSWFGLEVDGWENLPPAPVLLVSNHSGGTTVPDVWGLLIAWIRRFGTERIIHALGHDMVFSLLPVARFFGELGVLRAGRERGRHVLVDLKRDLFVCPGGDRDTWRPTSDQYKVNFAGRKGYARLALEAGVPIVPVAHVGAQHSLYVFSDGSRLARVLGLQRAFRAGIWPLHLSVPWGVGVGPMPHIPLPVTLRYRIGKPIQPVGSVDDVDEAVRAAIQTLLDQMREDRAPLGQRLRAGSKRLGGGVRHRKRPRRS